jgi:hypothetical protein
MFASATLEVDFQILDYFREYPLFVNLWLIAPAVVEMEIDSVEKVAPPGQAAIQ